MRQLKIEWDAVRSVEEEDDLQLTGQSLALWQRLVQKVRASAGDEDPPPSR